LALALELPLFPAKPPIPIINLPVLWLNRFIQRSTPVLPTHEPRSILNLTLTFGLSPLRLLASSPHRALTPRERTQVRGELDLTPVIPASEPESILNLTVVLTLFFRCYRQLITDYRPPITGSRSPFFHFLTFKLPHELNQ